MCASIDHVCLCLSSSCHVPPGGRVPSHTQGRSVSAGGKTSSPYCGLLTTIHMYCDLFSPTPPQCKLPSAGSQAAPQPGPCTLAVYCCLGQQRSLTAPLLLRRHRLLGCQGNTHWLLYSCLWQLPFSAASPFLEHHLWLQSCPFPFLGHCSLSDQGFPQIGVSPAPQQSGQDPPVTIRVPYCTVRSRSFLFTLAPLEHSLCHSLLFPRLSHLTFVTAHLTMSRSLAAFPCVSMLRWSGICISGVSTQPQDPHGDHPLPGSECLLQQHLLVDKTLGTHHGKLSVFSEARFLLIYLIIPTHIDPLFVAWKKMRKKGGKMPVGVGMLQSQSAVMQTKLSADPCEAGTHACTSSDLLRDLGHESPLAGLR